MMQTRAAKTRADKYLTGDLEETWLELRKGFICKIRGTGPDMMRTLRNLTLKGERRSKTLIWLEMDGDEASKVTFLRTWLPWTYGQAWTGTKTKIDWTCCLLRFFNL